MSDFDKLSGENGELVEFRKKQVLNGAMDIIRRHYVGEPNKMEVIAAIFGKKLNERFTIEYYGTKFDCWFIGGTFEVIDAPPFTHCFDEQVLYGLITGEAVISR